MQRVKAEPDAGNGEGSKPPGRADREHEIREPDEHAAEDGKSRLPELIDKLLHGAGIDEAADPECAHDQTHGGEAQAEAQV